MKVLSLLITLSILKVCVQQTCPSFSGTYDWQISHDFGTNETFFENTVTRVNYFSVLNTDIPLNISLAFDGPGTLTLYPSPSALGFVASDEITINGNQISYNGTSTKSLIGYGLFNSSVNYRINFGTATACAGLYNWFRWTEVCPKKNTFNTDDINRNSSCLNYTPTCYPCDCSCSSCSGPGVGQCTACKAGYYMTQITENRSDTDSETGLMKTITYDYLLCPACHSSCATCNDSTSTSCFSCNNGFYLQPNSTTCLSTCPMGYYRNFTQNICSPCDIACKSCTGPTSSECVACQIGYYQQPSSSTTCLSTCPSTHWADIFDNICRACDTACLTCFGSSSSECNSCKPNYFRQSPTSTTCKTTCPSGYFKNFTEMVCIPCNPACSVCSGTENTACTACNSGYYLQINSATCLNTCQVGYIAAPWANACSPCYIGCATCTNYGYNLCLTCFSGYYFQPTSTNVSSCLTFCPLDGYWADSSSNKCVACASSCKRCTGPTNSMCTVCNNGYYLQPNSMTCDATCPQNYFPDSTSNTCKPCDSACTICTGSTPSSCSACQPGLYLLQAGTSCLTSCPTTFKNRGYWTDTLHYICSPCDDSCSTCTGPTNADCLACNKGYYLSSTSNACLPCSEGCATCTSSSSEACTSCFQGFYMQPTSNSCRVNCPEAGYWPNPSDNKCAQCNPACTQCTGPEATSCQTCSPGFFKQPSSTECITSCSQGYYKDNNTNSCSPCSEPCLTCTGASNASCLSCLPEYFLQGSSTTCLERCAEIWHWPNPDGNKCTYSAPYKQWSVWVVCFYLVGFLATIVVVLTINKKYCLLQQLDDTIKSKPKFKLSRMKTRLIWFGLMHSCFSIFLYRDPILTKVFQAMIYFGRLVLLLGFSLILIIKEGVIIHFCIDQAYFNRFSRPRQISVGVLTPLIPLSSCCQSFSSCLQMPSLLNS